MRYAVVTFLTGAALLAFSYAAFRHQIGPGAEFETISSSAKTGGVPAVKDKPANFESSISPQARAYIADRNAQALKSLLAELGGALAVTTFLSAAVGWLLAGRALAPMSQITAAAKRVSQQSMNERINLDGPYDELRELADTFDAMLSDIEQAFLRERRFVANASHELRTPLAVMRTALDISAEQELNYETDQEMRRTVTKTLNAADQLVMQLLELAKSQRGTGQTSFVQLHDVVAEAIGASQSAAGAQGIELIATLSPAVVDGNQTLLKTLVVNLLENAIIYGTRSPVEITVETHKARSGDQAVLVIESGGPPIAQETIQTWTQPFIRGPHKGQSGFGLGLSIVEAIATAHDGTIHLMRRPQGGIRAQVALPVTEDHNIEAHRLSVITAPRS